MSDLQIPNFGELLVPYISQVPEHAVPNFLALLERGAAQRYRLWAQALPEQATGLLECAAREDEIADHAEQLFPIDDATQKVVEAPLPAAMDTYMDVFAGLDTLDQMRIQANAERQGAAAWRGMKSDQSPAQVNERLEQIASIEEVSADFLDQLLAG